MRTILSDNHLKTVRLALQWACDDLRAAGVESPKRTAELLLSHVLQCHPKELVSRFEHVLSQEEAFGFVAALDRRKSGEPAQYIIGETEFMGKMFKVDPRVLIPRPETEILVREAIDIIHREKSGVDVNVLDVGTGSGNIAISLAALCTNALITALDVSSEALEVARENAARHGVSDRIQFVEHDILTSSFPFIDRAYDLIVSNPPYISDYEFSRLPDEISKHEPAAATLAGGDGLKFYRRLHDLGNVVVPGGWMLMEIAYDQGETVRAIFSTGDYAEVSCSRDFDGKERVVKARRRK